MKKSEIEDLLNELVLNDIHFVYLRDVKSFEQVFIDKEGGDIDLYVDENHLEKFNIILSTYGFYNLFDHKVFCSIKESEIISIDAHNGLYERLPILNSSNFLSCRGGNTEIPMLDDYILLAVLLLHPLDLTGLRGHRNYTNTKIVKIKSLWKNKIVRTKFLNWVKLEISESFASFVTKELPDRLELLPTKINKLKWLMYKNNFRNLKYLCIRLKKKILKPKFEKGYLITLMGVDGSGKSTALEGLAEFVNRYYNSEDKIKIIYMGSQGGYCFPLARLAEFRNKLFGRNKRSSIEKVVQEKTSGNSPRHNNSMSISYLIKSVFIVLEYLIRLVKIHYYTKIKCHIVLTDRYVYDVAREGIDLRVVDFIGKLFPMPSRTFLMKGDVVEFFRRKGEYSVNELKEHQDALETFLSKKLGKKLTLIDADRSQKEVLSQILHALSVSEHSK